MNIYKKLYGRLGIVLTKREDIDGIFLKSIELYVLSKDYIDQLDKEESFCTAEEEVNKLYYGGYTRTKGSWRFYGLGRAIASLLTLISVFSVIGILKLILIIKRQL